MTEDKIEQIKKRILITGATDGIGKQTAVVLAGMNHEIIVHGRNIERCVLTVDEIKKRSKNENIFYSQADLSSLDSVRKMAEKLRNDFDRLDVLINNAGVYMSKFELSPDGFEMTFAVNHLSHFLLTLLLKDLLLSSISGRIINVSSIAHMRGTIDFDNLRGGGNFSPYGAYAASKLANMLFTYELSEKIEGASPTVNALHPGVIDTKLLREGFGSMGADIEFGASTSVYLAQSADVEGVTGKYFADSEEKQSSKLSRDLELRRRLWDVSLEMTGMKDSDW